MAAKRLLSVTALITSQQCGHCVNMRTDGRLKTDTETAGMRPGIPGDHKFNHAFLLKLLAGDRPGNEAYTRVVNIHTTSLDGRTIMEFAEFFLEADGSIRQEISRPQPGTEPKLLEVEKMIVKADTKTKPGSDISKKISATWADFLKENVPTRILPYMYSFPSFMMFSGENWVKGLQGEEMYGVVLGAETRTAPPYGLIRDSVADRPVDPIPEHKRYLFGEKSLIVGHRAAAGPPVASQPPNAHPPNGSGSIMAPTAIPQAVAPAQTPEPISVENRKLWLPTGNCRNLGFRIAQLNSTR